MTVRKRNRFAFLVIALFAASSLKAQYASEEELKKAADKFFNEENYNEALPLFSQLLSLYPKDPNYNYKYGASFLFAKRDKEDALRYLRFAASRPGVDPKAFYFLGLAEHHNYSFDVAESNYNKFKQKGNPKDVSYFDVDRKIAMSQNGRKLLKSMTDIGVLYKKEIKETDFFRSYDLKGIGGKVVVKPDEFKTKLDLKRNENSLIHLGDRPNMVIFSSYGKDGKRGKDIYKVVKLPNGEWSNPSVFGDVINSEFDEDFPFLHPDGKTLYFSSKGFNSMGGYDIFKSTLNAETGEWSYPENLDFPINTPDDDVLFISDIDNELAFFASSRASKQGELTVYKVQVASHPTETSIIKGIFLAESNPSLKDAKISIMHPEKDRNYGDFTTNENGDYLLVFPGNGGKFKILVETTNDSPIHSAIIDIPPTEGFRALKQELRLVGEGDAEKLVVKNLFDETDEFDITDPLVVENLLKVKAKLNVNLTEEELQQQAKESENETATLYSNMSDEELLEAGMKKADVILDKHETSKVQTNFAYQISNEKGVEAKNLYNQSKQLLSEGNEAEAEKEKLNAAKLVNESVASLNLAKVLESESNEIESDIEKVQALKETISSNLANGNREGAEAAYGELLKISEAAYIKESALNNEKQIVEDQITEKLAAYNKARNTALEVANREVEIESEITALEKQLSETNKKKEKEEIQAKIDMAKIDLEDIKYELQSLTPKETAAKEEYELVYNKSNVAKSVIAEVEGVEPESVEISEVDKLSLDNNVVYFENEGLVGLYPEESNLIVENSSTNENTSIENPIEESIALNETSEKINSETTNELTEEVAVETNNEASNNANESNVVEESETATDYNKAYANKLVAAENTTDPYQKNLQLAQINQDWANDIDQEILSKENELSLTEELNDKVRLESEIEELKSLKEEKQKEANLQLTIAETLSPSDNSNSVAENIEEENTEEAVTSETEEPVDIIDAEGNVVDYNTSYAEKVTELKATRDDDALKSALVEWNNAIEQDVLLKEMAISESEDDSEKNQLQSEIDALSTQLDNNRNEIVLLETKDALVASNTVEETEELSSESNYSEIIDDNGEIIDYNSEFESKLSETNDLVDNNSKVAAREEITKDWIASIDKEITYRNELIDESEDETFSAEQEAKINELNALKNEQQEALADLQLAINNESEIAESTNEENTESTESLGKASEAIASYDNVLNFEKSEVDKNLKIDYNPNLVYSSGQANQELNQAESKKQEINAVYDEIEIKNQELFITQDVEIRESLINETEELKADAESKEIALARMYEKSNKSEFYNNQSLLSKVKLSSTANANDKLVAEMMEDEAANFFDLAAEERQKANNYDSFSGKEQSLQKAYNFEIQALEKQNKAIKIYAEGSNLETLYSANENTVNEELVSENENIIEENETVEEGLTSDTNIETEENSIEESINESSAESVTNNNIVAEEANENVNEAALNESVSEPSNEENNLANSNGLLETQNLQEIPVNETPVYQPLAVSLPSDEIKGKAKELESEAEALDLQAKILMDSSETISKRKEKEAVIENAIGLTEQANQKRKEAEVLYAEANENQAEEAELVDALNEQRSEVSEEVLTTEEQSLVANMSSAEIEELSNSTEFQTYANVQQEKRRLVKEAEVDYIEADKFAQEAEDEKALGISLNALAAGAQGERKTKLLGQIEQLKGMISENENKASEARSRATEKEILALEKGKEANAILTSASNGDKIKAIEKTASFNNELLLAAKTNNSEPIASVNNENEIEEETPITENPISNEVINDNVIAETETEKNTLEETTASNNETEVNNIEESNVEEVENITELEENTTIESPKIEENVAENIVTEEEEETNNEIESTEELNTENVNEESFTENNVTTENNEVEAVNESNEAITSFNDSRLFNNPLEVTSPVFIFEANSTASPYSESNPIPTNESMPEGLVFKVQVGAFRNPIPQDHFKGFAPIMVEPTGNGIKRYTAGFFKGIIEAVEAKNSIRTIGYSDAFVVAFYNGKRISIAEARNLINTTQEELLSDGNITEPVTEIEENNNLIEENSSNPVESNVTTINEIPPVEENFEEVNDGVSTDVHNIKGVFFTVQVGVYSKPVTAQQLNNVKPLNSERTSNGLIRYTSGVYKTLDEANSAKDRVRELGISDAFVIAYANGNRVTVNEAVNYVKSQANPTEENLEENITEPEVENNSIDSSSNNQPDETIGNNSNENSVNELTKEDQIVIGEKLALEFRVVLGEYAEEVPVEDAAKYLRLSSQGIKNYQEEGKSIYSIGAYPDYSSALEMQLKMNEEENFTNTKIVVFKSEQKITIEEALELVKNNQE